MTDSLEQPTPRQAARISGQSRYKGKPCKAGHVERYTSTGGCAECQTRSDPGAADRVRRWREANTEAAAKHSAESYAKAQARSASERAARTAMARAASTIGRLAAAMGAAAHRVDRDTRRQIMAPMTDAQRRRWRALERIDL